MLDHLSGQRVAGIILAPNGSSPEYVARVNQLKMPLVLIDHRIPGVECDFVGSDNVLASAMLTEHLIRFGHRRIAHIVGRAGLYTSGKRIQGFLETMRGEGIEVDPSLIVDGDYQGARLCRGDAADDQGRPANGDPCGQQCYGTGLPAGDQ